MSRAARTNVLAGVFLLVLALILAGCGGGGGESGGGGGGGEEKKEQSQKEKEQTKEKAKTGGGGAEEGQIAIEGSSTVLPITQAAAEAFNQENPNVDITVGGSGTGDGMEAFCAGEIPIADASRPIKDEEAQACQENGVEFIELAIARDGITVVTNPQNPLTDVTTEQLMTLFEPSAEGQINNLNQVDPSFPDQQVSLYGPGTESGTFEFFTEKVNGKAKEQRTDYNPSEDDNVLVNGVANDPNAIGYFGFSYFEQNQNRLKAITVDGVQPTAETINSGEYPLSRPLFIYVSQPALEENPEVEQFVQFYLDNLNEFVTAANYVPLNEGGLQETQERFQTRNPGTDPVAASKGEKGKEDDEKNKEKTK